MSRSYTTEGIILKRVNFGEADKLLTIYTKHYGKIRAIAKGVRRIVSRKAGHVEIFNLARLFLSQGKNLDILTEAQTINSFRAWRKELKKVAVAYYFCELVDKLTPDNQPNRQVFELLKNYLGKIGSASLSSLSVSFEKNLLRELGFGIPKGVEESPEGLKSYIESITERKISSLEITGKL